MSMSWSIEVIGAKTHNLKNVSLSFPKNALVVITGVSWSGKSSLAFDTVYAEGQRRYLESLSTYARMIISSINEDTQVEEIRWLSPTIAINQKTVSSNPRSIVGTITEIYDFYRLLFTTIGQKHCVNHPDVVLENHTLDDIVEYVEWFDEWEKLLILAPFSPKHHSLSAIRDFVVESGFVRFSIDGVAYSVGDDLDVDMTFSADTPMFIIVDRLIVKKSDEEREGFLRRFRDSVSASYAFSDGRTSISLVGGEPKAFSQNSRCPKCGYVLKDLQISHFSFNSHYGACQDCHGLWRKTTFLEENVINPRLTLAEGAILPWGQMMYYGALIESVCKTEGIPMDKPFGELSPEQKTLILFWSTGTYPVAYGDQREEKMHRSRYEWVIPSLNRRYLEGVQDENFVKRVAQYATDIPCHVCHGYRLQEPYLRITVQDLNIGQLTSFSVDRSLEFFRSLTLTKNETIITKRILKNIVDRLEFLAWVGLGYVALDRTSGSLSWGESQRIRLATQIGSKLEGILYVLDEPSIGLHPRDNRMLIQNIKKLVSLGNTVLVVEHDDEIMQAADYIIDIGPGAGKHGWSIVSTGTYEEICQDPNSDTGAYLSGRKRVRRENRVKKFDRWIQIRGARENNLKSVNADLPLSALSVVTWVSWSGKSSLVMDILAQEALFHLNGASARWGKHDSISGLDQLEKAVIIDQSPIWRTPHSNIATYTGVFTLIREVFAGSLEAQKRGYNIGRFSFNTKGGRCESCEGTGTKKIEMHFLPDVYVECEHCGGSRYNSDTLDVKFKGKNIAEVLRMTVEEALDFFKSFPRITRVLSVLDEVWLGYIELGQSAPTLSGGEAQRIKLAFDLSKKSNNDNLYILDEPTTGLHFSDVQKLLLILDRLVERGNTVVVIEHNLDIISQADYVVDIWPEGGDKGGTAVYQWSIDGLLKNKESLTAEALARYESHYANR